MKSDEYRFLEEAGDSHWWQRGMRELTIEFVERKGLKSPFIDIGCGSGHLLRDLMARGHHGVGVEPDPHGVAAARRVCASRTVVVASDPSEYIPLGLPVNPESIILADVLTQDTFDLEDFLAAVERGVEAECPILYLRVPAVPSLLNDHDLIVGQSFRYSRRRLEQELSAAGYRIDDRTFANMVLLPAYWAIALAQRLRGPGRELRSLNSEFPFLLNRMLLLVLRWEATMVRRGVRLPFGSTLLVRAVRERSHE